MAPKDIIFYEENVDKLEFEDGAIEPCILVPPAVSTLSINNLPIENDSLEKINWFTRLSGIIYTLLSSLLFTSATFFIKYLGVDLLDGLIPRFIVQILVIFLFARYKHYSLLSGTIIQISQQIFCCIIGASTFFLFFAATRYIELSDTTTLCYTRVVWTVVLSMIVYRERPLIGSLIALPLTLLGVAFVSQPSFLFSSAISSTVIENGKLRLLGLSLAIASALASAAYVLSFKQLVSTSNTIKSSVLNFQYSIVVFLFLIIDQLYKKYFLHNGLLLNYILSWRYILAVLLSFVTILSNIIKLRAMKREHPAIFTLIGSSEIIFALILQNIFTVKTSNSFALIGSALIILSVVILGLSKIMHEKLEQKKLKPINHQPIINDVEESK